MDKCVCDKSKSESCRVGGDFLHEPTFFEAVLSDVRKQVEYNCFSEEVSGEVENICRIIAEVYILPANTPIRIEGTQIPARVVRDIYKQLTHEHIALCLESFFNASYKIRYIKGYFRTALYNSVLEFDLHYRNQVEADLSGGGT